MKTIGFCMVCVLATALVTPALMTSAPVAEDGFTLPGVIPNDVFFYVGERPNPEREFVARYWEDVFDALAESGVGEDVIGLFGSLLGAKQVAEMERLKERASQLVAGVNWEQLEGKENAIAERFVPPALTELSGGRPPIMLADMVWLARGSGEGAARNYEGLVAILEGVVDEVNNAMGSKALAVDRTTQRGAKVASVNLLAAVPGAPALPISVALRDDVVIIALRKHLFSDVLSLLDGGGKKKALGDDSRFKAAFAQLPVAEDSMAFFDMQAMVKPMRGFLDVVIGEASAPRDVTRHTGMSEEVRKLNASALSAYRRGDAKEALALTEQAYAAGPDNSVILYNLACFNALVGNKNEALNWLDKAVEGGFYAPRKISEDADLTSLHGNPKYKAALAKASELASEYRVEDVAMNAAKTGEVFRLRMQVRQAHEQKDYEQGLKLIEQAYAVAPNDSQVLYILGCLHNLLGHEKKGLDFLEKAVEGGFYCPSHISKDPDWESVRGHKRYRAATAKARIKAVELATQKEHKKTAVVKRLVDRLMDAMGILDYSAAVETTDGYTTGAESIVALVPDAKERPIYAVFGKRQPLTDFDRYVPQEAVSFAISGGFDLGELYNFIEESVRIAGPPGEELLTKWAELQKQLGVDVRKDVIGWIDGDSVSVALADGGSVLMLKVTNEQIAREKVSAAIEFLSTKLPEVAAKKPAMAGLAMLGVRTSPIEHAQLEGFQNLHIGMSPQPAVWGVADGYLIFGSSAETVALCLATARGEHPNIRNNARAMSESIVPAGPFVGVSLTDRRGLGEELAAGMGIASMVTGTMGAFVPEPKLRPVLAKIAGMLGKLAPVAHKIDFYKSAAAHTTFDGKVWHSHGVTHYFSPAERAATGTE